LSPVAPVPLDALFDRLVREILAVYPEWTPEMSYLAKDRREAERRRTPN
jgi:hypothetical protein